MSHFLNRHVSWDSEYYLAIAVGGYEAPGPARIRGQFGTLLQVKDIWPFVIPPQAVTVPGFPSATHSSRSIQ